MQGRWKEAAKLLEQALERELKYVGKKHPNTAAIMYSLSINYLAQRRLTEAFELEREASKTRRAMLVNRDTDMILSMKDRLQYVDLKSG